MSSLSERLRDDTDDEAHARRSAPADIEGLKILGPLDLVAARGQASGMQMVRASGRALEAGWSADWQQRTQLLWDTCRGLICAQPDTLKRMGEDLLPLNDGHLLRWEGALGSEDWPEGRPAGPPLHFKSAQLQPTAPTVVPLQGIEGGDNHRFRDSEGHVRRLHARRQDIDVRAGEPQRQWVRRSPEGGVISDLLCGAVEAVAPAGQAFLWSWAGEVQPHSPLSIGELRGPDLSVSPPAGALKRTRLVPLQTGSW